MILAISGQALSRSRSLDQILSFFNELGVRWIELWPLNLEGEGSDPVQQENRYEGKDLEKTLKILNAYGIGVACVTMPGAFVAEIAADPQNYLAALRTTIDAAVALDAKLVNSYCYHFALGREADITPLVSVLRPAAEYAAERGITLVLENEAHDATATADGMHKIIEAVGSPAMKTNLDPCNYYQATEEPFPYAYFRLKDCLGYVHLKNGCVYDPQRFPEYRKRSIMTGRSAEQNICYLPIPEGAVNIEGLIAQLHNDRYQGFCTLEPHVPKEMLEEYYRAEVAYTRRLGIE
jgi:sugar phosphate isomerase/epimerase